MNQSLPSLAGEPAKMETIFMGLPEITVHPSLNAVHQARLRATLEQKTLAILFCEGRFHRCSRT
jgi:hypothetical protein